MSVKKPVILVPELGEQGLLPDGAIINAGGVEGPTFTVGGKAVLFTDGTSSDGGSTVINLGANVKGLEFIQASPLAQWDLVHNQNTLCAQVSVWNTDNETVLARSKIVDANTVRIFFNTPQAGRAILMLF